jgi:hypothetical protein
MGIVVEYAGRHSKPPWLKPPDSAWNYTVFGSDGTTSTPDHAFSLVFEKVPGGRGGFNRWTINGKSFPDTEPLLVEAGKQYRLVLRNKSGDAHPIHLHRHMFELTKVAGKSTSGVFKDVISVPRYQTAEVDFVADDPGLTLFHCHMQLHQDFGFMTLVSTSSTFARDLVQALAIHGRHSIMRNIFFTSHPLRRSLAVWRLSILSKTYPILAAAIVLFTIGVNLHTFLV